MLKIYRIVRKNNFRLASAMIFAVLVALGPRSFAATDDNAFNDCLRRYARIPEIQPDQVWKNSPLPEQIITPMQLHPSIEFIVRWTEVRNPNGTSTIIVLTRYPGPQDEDAQDLFYVLLKNGDRVSSTIIIAANASFFAKESSDGTFGLFFCTQGDLDSMQPLLWHGQGWG